MTLQLEPITTAHPQYPFVEELLHSAFPTTERRDDDAQRKNTDDHPAFTCYLITDNGESIGTVTVWQLEGFHYIEHLATSPSVRNRGYGRRIMETLSRQLPGLTVLEVEPPTEETSIRRIGFYCRCGFTLCERPYLQPPYRKGDDPLPLLLMFTGADSIDGTFDTLSACIHREVYGVR